MKDTRDTSYRTKCTPAPRFKKGDQVLIPHGGAVLSQTVNSVWWDKSFGGWCVCTRAIGIHEQNYILAGERDQWEPHEEGLWSWWTKKARWKQWLTRMIEEEKQYEKTTTVPDAGNPSTRATGSD